MSVPTKRICTAIVALSWLMSTACIGEVGAKEIPSPGPAQPTPVPRAVSLPEDDGPHETPIEWWYYNGHLESENGREFSFHFVIFSTKTDQGTTAIRFGQAGITDVAGDEHFHLSSSTIVDDSVAAESTDAARLSISLTEFQLTIDADGKHKLSAVDPRTRTEIHLESEVPNDVMLHSGKGWMDWPFGWTYYYSYPKVRAEGRLIANDETFDVSGEIWFDHQWGDFFVVGNPAGWQWFALHLDDGRSVMVSEVRGAYGEVVGTDATVIRPGEPQIVFDDDDGIDIKVLDHWTSPNTGGTYPSKWRLALPDAGMDVILVPSTPDQEIPPIPFGNQAAAYWEGSVDVVDATTGASSGRGFVELSGYVDPDPLEWRVVE